MLEEGLKIVSIFSFYFIDSDMLWFLSFDKCIYCKSLWTKVSAKCPKYKCKFSPQNYSWQGALSDSASEERPLGCYSLLYKLYRCYITGVLWSALKVE